MFYDKLKLLCAEHGTTPTALLTELGLSTGSLSNYKKGTIPKGRVLKMIAEKLGVSVEYLLQDKPVEEVIKVGDDVAAVIGKKNFPAMSDRELYESVTTISFPVIGKVRAGYGGMAQEEYTNENCPIPAEYIKGHNKEDFFVLRISGNSMYPKLLDGDKVLVERCTAVDSGSIAIVLYDSEEATVKTVRYVTGEDWVELIPANPEYQTKRIEGPDLMKVQILGRVRKLIRDI